MNYQDLGYDGFLTRVVETTRRATPLETRNANQPGTLIADGVNISSMTIPLTIDKDGIQLGDAAPDYAEGRLYYDFTTGKIYIGGNTDWEALN